MQFCKRFLAIILALVTVVCSQTIVASADEDPVKILFLGNSLVYYNEMDTKIFPELCAALGKNVVVESVVESGSSLYRLSNEKTSKGKEVKEKLQSNTYDYVILQPSRHVSPYEYSTYHVEYASALKLNKIISETGAKTLLLASPGVNTGEIELCTVDEENIKIVENEYLPIDRKTHQRFFENLCNDLIREMTNASIVRVGAAAEMVIENFPDFNSLYKDDNRHPSVRGSYLQACSIFATIFGQTPVGAGYVESIYPHNAIVLQRAAEIISLGSSPKIFDSEKAEVTLSGEMWSNSEINLYWNEPKVANYYEIYRKAQSEKSFANIGRTVGNELGYLDSTANAGKVYEYKVQPYYQVGDLVFKANETAPITFETLAKPAKPTVTLVGQTTATLTLTAVNSAQYYSIYRKANDETDYSYVCSTKSLEYVDDELEPGKFYKYYVVAEKQNGMVVSKNSATNTVFTAQAPKLKVSSASGKVTVSITAVSGANKYAIYYKKSSETDYKLLAVTSSTSYIVTGLAKGVKYNFKVRACKDKNTDNTAGLYRTKSIKVK